MDPTPEPAASRQNFPNLAGAPDPDETVRSELRAAGILPCRYPASLSSGEVATRVWGIFEEAWSFRRAWRYWVAEGPGLPPDIAMALFESHGRSARAHGDGGCRSPHFWDRGFGTGFYHVDTPEGLLALAQALRQAMTRAEALHGPGRQPASST